MGGAGGPREKGEGGDQGQTSQWSGAQVCVGQPGVIPEPSSHVHVTQWSPVLHGGGLSCHVLITQLVGEFI